MASGITHLTPVREHHERLLGREDVLARLDRLLRDGGASRGWVLVKGGPGMGKSTLLVHYLSRLEARGYGVPHHFLRRGSDDDGDHPEVVRENLVAQVEKLFPEQAVPEALPESRLREVLQRVSQTVLVPRGERLVLVIDGLDEVEPDGGGGNPLPRFLPHVLPRGVWVLCASRPIHPHLAWLEAREEGVHCIDLDDKRWAESNELVVRRYWADVAPGIEPPLDPAFVAEAVQRAEGNILYAVKLAEWVREQPAERRRVELLPRGLDAFLLLMWTGIQVQPQELRTRVSEGLALVAVARESLPLSLLASVAGWKDEAESAQFLTTARQFLLEEPARGGGESVWRPFHESFRAFIFSKLGEERIRNEHRRMAERLCSWPPKVGEDFRRRYCLRHAVTHALEAGDGARARSLCTDLGYLDAKCREVGVAAVEKDLLRTIRVSSGSDQSSLRELHRAVQAESHWLGKGSGALERLVYNRLLSMGWTRARIEEWLRFPEGLPAFRLRHPVRMGGGEIRTLVGHRNAVEAGAMTPDGRFALSASDDHTLKLWSLRSGRELATFKGHKDKVMACALTPDGRLALSASADQTLKLWDFRNRRILFTLKGHKDKVMACALTPDGRLALSASADRTLKLWNLQTGRALATLKGHKDQVTACALTPDGRLGLSASFDKTLKLWDFQARCRLFTLEGHKEELTACALTPDGRFALSASVDHTLKLWSLRSRRELVTLSGHEDWVTACALTDDGRFALSASEDHTLKLWNLRAGRELATLKGHEGAVTACALTRHARYALSSSEDRTLKLWSPQNTLALAMHPGHRDWVTACALDANGRLGLSASHDRSLKLWDIQSGHVVTTLEGHKDVVNACTLTADGRLGLSASDDQTLKLWDLETKRELATFTGHEYEVTDCGMTADGRLALSASLDRTLRLWDVAARRELCILEGHQDFVTACALTPDGRLGLSASDDRTLKLWDLETKRELATLKGHEYAVTDCALSVDGRFAFSSSIDRTLKLWNLQSGECLRTVQGCSDFVSLALSRDILCAGDKFGNVWILEEGLRQDPSVSMRNKEPGVKPSHEPLFTWLHLSDIHIGHGNASHRWDQKLVLEALREDIAAQRQRGLPSPDTIVVTGDIAFSGIEPQYAQAKEWLREVAATVGLGLRQVFSVPGNHDVERAADQERSLGRLVRALREGAETLDEVLAHENDRKLLTRRMAHYLAFAADLAPACLQENQPPELRLFWSHRMQGREGLRVRLVGLNTALLSAAEPDPGRLRLGKEALSRAFVNPPVEEGELVLALSHHPFRDGWLADQRESDAWVRNRAHIHLSGHVHAADSEEARAGAGGGVVRIVAGAVHEEHQAGMPPSHGYNLAAVHVGEDGTLRLRVWPRLWSDKTRDFRLDVGNVPQGREFAEHRLSLTYRPSS